MNFAQFTLQEQGVIILAALVLFASFSLLAQTRIIACIHAFAWQGALVAAAALVAFSYYVALPVEKLSTLATRNTIAISMAVVLLGMLIMVTRRQAITQVVGFMSMENGLFFAAVVSTHGMPMVVELGIAFDLLVATVIFGLFFFQIRQSIDSLDVDRLSRLAETAELDEAGEGNE